MSTTIYPTTLPNEKSFNIVYKTTNLINGMIYVGEHATNKLEDGYIGTGKAFLKAVKEFGRNNFSREILSCHESKSAARTAEALIVSDEFRTRNDNYNIHKGGGGWDMSGFKHSEEFCARRSILATEQQSNGNGHYKGHTHTEETKRHIGESSAGRIVSSETREKKRVNNLGEKNPSYNKHWYTNGIENCLCLEENIPDNYVLGRKLTVDKHVKL